MLRMIKKLAILFLTIGILFFILFYVIKVQDIILKKIYPLQYSEYVEKYAKENELDPLLVYAIIKAESNFEKNVVSSSNAIGLMQLLPDTAEEIAEQEGYDYIAKESLYNPEINIQTGTKYFANLLKTYDNCIPIALAAYNAGMGNVEKWIVSGIIKKDGSDIENIPFKETNHYVRKILRDYQIYQDLYRKGENT